MLNKNLALDRRLAKLERRQQVEHVLLSNAMQSKVALSELLSNFNESHFFNDLSKKIIRAIQDLYAENIKVDLVNMRVPFLKYGSIEDWLKVVDIYGVSVSAADNFNFVLLLKEYNIREKVKKTIKEMQTDIDDADIFDWTSNFQNSLLEIMLLTEGEHEFPSSRIEKYAESYREKLLNSTKLETGFKQLDYMITGFYPSDLVYVGARPSVGKTSLLLSIFCDMVFNQDKPVAFFSLEMNFYQIYQRILAIQYGINLKKLRQESLSDDDMNKIKQYYYALKTKMLVIDDTPGLTDAEFQAKVKLYQSKYGIKCAIIDYVGLMKSSSRFESRNLELGSISRNLKMTAKLYDIPIMAAAQLNREIERRADPTPMLSDLRDSGELEQDADLIMFIDRRKHTTETNEKFRLKPEGKLIVAKQRNGEVGAVDIYFKEETAKYTAMDTNYEEKPAEIKKRRASPGMKNSLPQLKKSKKNSQILGNN